MKEIEKISISGIAFTLELDAIESLNNYLDSLRNYYKNVAGNEEIVADVEERIAELLIERGGKERVVDSTDIQYIITTLGTPEELEDADVYNSTGEKGNAGTEPGQNKQSVDGNVKKRLYRDVRNRVLGGVCSGLANYYGISIVWIRVILVLAVMFGSCSFLGHSISSILLLGYIILWIVVPPARTVAQRCSMGGIDPGLDGIQDYKNKTVNDMKHSENKILHLVGRIVGFVMGIIMIVTGMCGLVFGLVMLFGVDIFTGFTAYSLMDYIVQGMGLYVFKIAMLGVWFIPCIAFLYAGSMLCFRFKSPKWRPGLILFILWVISVITALSMGFSKVLPLVNHSEQRSYTVLNKQYDTLYVNFEKPQLSGSEKMYMKENFRGDVSLLYVDKTTDGKAIVYYPHFEIDRYDGHKDDDYKAESGRMPRIVVKKKIFHGGSLLDMAAGDTSCFEIKDSLITISPKMISRGKPFDGTLTKLELEVPQNTVVIMQEPKRAELGPHRYDD